MHAHTVVSNCKDWRMAKREELVKQSTRSFPIFTIGLETLAMLQHHHVSKLFFSQKLHINSLAFSFFEILLRNLERRGELIEVIER